MDASQTKAAEAQPDGQMDVVEDVEYGDKEVSYTPSAYLGGDDWSSKSNPTLSLYRPM